MDQNPFAPLPSYSAVGGGPAAGLHRQGADVVAELNSTWPARCVKCNRDVPAADFVVKAQWVPRWVIVVFVLSRLIGLILYFVKRRRFTFHVGLCEEHRAARTRNQLVGGGILALGVLTFVASGVLEADAGFLLGGVTVLVGIIWWALAATLLRITKVEGEQAWIRGKGPFFDGIS